MPKYSVNDNVRYKPVGGRESNTSETVGVVRQVITEPGSLTGRQVQASTDDPRYETRLKTAIPANGPRSWNPTSLHMSNFCKPQTAVHQLGGCSWASWLQPARGEEETFGHDLRDDRVLRMENNELTALEMEMGMVCVDSECEMAVDG